MPIASAGDSQSSWVAAAGYLWIRRLQVWLVTLGGVPFVWFILRHDVASNRFVWATIVLIAVPMTTTPWAATKIVCPLCRTHVYLFWLFGFPKHQERRAFDMLQRCPYCSDDGTGRTGDARGVDPRREAGRVARRVLVWLVVVFAVAVVFTIAVLFGWVPGYRRLL